MKKNKKINLMGSLLITTLLLMNNCANQPNLSKSGLEKNLLVQSVVSKTQRVSTGFGFNCALENSGATCWGMSMKDFRASSVTAIANTAGMNQICSGAEHSCVASSNEVRCWGLNQYGQLGNGSFSNSAEVATKVVALQGKISDLSCGSFHTCVVIDGKVKCWGLNAGYSLGVSDANRADKRHSTNVEVLLPEAATKVSAGNTSCAILANTQVYCWGKNMRGMIANPQIAVFQPSLPQRIEFSSGIALEKVTEISSGFNHVCAIANQELWCWGDNTYGQLGLSGSQLYSSEPIKNIWLASNMGKPVKIVSGFGNACVLTTKDVYCWGNNDYGVVGNIISMSFLPVRLHLSVTANTISTFSMDLGKVAETPGAVTFCINDSISLRCRGTNFYGELGANANSPNRGSYSDLFTQIDIYENLIL